MSDSPKVLILEDKPDAERLDLHELLNKHHGDQIEMITDGLEGWKRLSDPKAGSHELIAVMLDLNLTSVSGLEILRRLRADPKLRHLHVVVMTDSTSDADIAKCIELGVTSFVPKPMTLAKFTKAIADCFHGARDAQRRRS